LGILGSEVPLDNATFSQSYTNQVPEVAKLEH
jgi:hypothetical protein